MKEGALKACHVIAGTLIIWFACVLCHAQTAGEASYHGKTIKLFDFEERKLGNFEKMPMNWYRVEAPRYPIFTEIGFDTEQHVSGEHSLKLSLNGGSVAAFVEKGVIPVIPDSDYRISAKLRTSKLKHARARIVVYFTDEDGVPITGSLAASALMTSEGRWTSVGVDIHGKHANAAWMIIRVQLLQPAEWESIHRDKHQIYHDDLNGAAWFDDISVKQMPRITLNTQSDTNVILSPEVPKLNFNVKDYSGDTLNADVVVYNHHLQMVATDKRELNGKHPSAWEWTPGITRFGWYYADLKISNNKGIVGRTLVGFLYLPLRESSNKDDLSKFQMKAEQVNESHHELVGKLVTQMDMRHLAWSVWWPDMSEDQVNQPLDKADDSIQKMLLAGRKLTLVLRGIPKIIDPSMVIDDKRPLSFILNQPKVTEKHLNALMVRYGQVVTDWQIGRSGSDEAVEIRLTSGKFINMTGTFSQYVAKPVTVLPWSSYYELPKDYLQETKFLLHVPAAIKSEKFESYSKSWALKDTTILLEYLKAGEFSHADRAEDLAMRMIEAWRLSPRGIAVDKLWAEADGRTKQILPDPLLGVWSNVSQMLAGRKFYGKYQEGEGLEVQILDGERGGVLVGWRTDHPTGELKLDSEVCINPQVIDLWGNRQKLVRQGNHYIIKLSQSPVFITGVNTQLLRFPASFKILPDFVVSELKFHEHEIEIENPWNVTLTGNMRMTSPKRWKFEPSYQRFSIPPKSKIKLPLRFTFPLSETGGRKMLTAQFNIESDKPYQITAQATVNIGLKSVELLSNVEIEVNEKTGKNDLIIVNRITNRSDEDQSMYTYVILPGLLKSERIVLSLKPGASIIKQFRFKDGAEIFSGQKGRAGIRLITGSSSMLNHDIEIP